MSNKLTFITFIFSSLLIIYLGVVFLPGGVDHLTVPLPKSLPPIDGQVLGEQVNSWRKAHNLTGLKTDESLCTYASKRAEQIKTEWNHRQFLEDHCSGTNFGYCGENLAKDNITAEQTLTSWVNSKKHLENLKKNWSNMCIVCSDNYCAQEFGR